MMTVFATSATTNTCVITCKREKGTWQWLARVLQTCHIKNQPANDANCWISPEETLAVQGLMINNNREVKFLPIEVNRMIPQLLAFEAKSCSVKSVESKHFKNMTSLAYLNLENNEISDISGDAFDDLIGLRHLSLALNKIESLEAGTLRNLINLTEFSLTGNRVKHLHESFCESLTSLRVILLSMNRIETLSENFFATNGKLKIIRLDQNNLTILSPIMFTNKKSLKLVGLGENPCVDATIELEGSKLFNAKSDSEGSGDFESSGDLEGSGKSDRLDDSEDTEELSEAQYSDLLQNITNALESCKPPTQEEVNEKLSSIATTSSESTDSSEVTDLSFSTVDQTVLCPVCVRCDASLPWSIGMLNLIFIALTLRFYYI